MFCIYVTQPKVTGQADHSDIYRELVNIFYVQNHLKPENKGFKSGMLIFCYFPLFSIIFGQIHYVNILYFLLFHLSLSELCLFLCSVSVRRQAHVDFQLFLQKSSGIPV